MRADVVKPHHACDEGGEQKKADDPAHEGAPCHTRGLLRKNKTAPLMHERGRVGFSGFTFRRYYLPKPKLKLTPERGRP